MTIFARICAIALTTLLPSSAANAQDAPPAVGLPAPSAPIIPTAASRTDANAIVALADVERQLDFALDAMTPAVQSSLIGQLTAAPDLADALLQIDARYPGGRAAFSVRFATLFRAQFRAAYPEVITRLTNLYATSISPADLASTRHFLESDAGRRWTATQPLLQREMASFGRTIGERAGSESMRLLMDELRAQGIRP